MSGRIIKQGTADVSTVIRIIDSTDGTPENAVEHNTAGIDLWYRREGAVKTSITEAALASLDAAHSDGGIELIGDGYYRLDLPDAACAASVAGVAVGGTVTDMIVIGTYHPLVAYDPQDTVRLGLTALPNAAADAAGGLLISDTGGWDADELYDAIITDASGANVAADIIAVKAETALIVADTNELQTNQGDWATATSVDLNAGAVDNASLAGNMEIVFETDFGTNYNVTRNAWVNNYTDTIGTDPVTAYDPPTNAEMEARTLVAASYFDPTADTVATVTDVTNQVTATANADAVWDEAAAGHVGAGTFGQQCGTDIDAILVDTNELQTDDVPGLIGALNDPTATAIVDEWETQSQADPTGFHVNVLEVGGTAQTANDNGADINAILTDTNELQTDWTNAGRLDTILDARAAQTTVDNIETDTQDIQSRLPAALVSGNMSSDSVAISGSTDAADKLEASAETVEIGTVSHDNTAASTTVFYSDDITEATTDHYKGRIVIFTSGALIRQATDITGYALVSGEGQFTVTALTEAPADNVTFVIV